MQVSRNDREWHLWNVVETTKGRDLIRKLYEELLSDKTCAGDSTAPIQEPPLQEMIEAILENEYRV